MFFRRLIALLAAIFAVPDAAYLDWLVAPASAFPDAAVTLDGNDIVLSNSLVERRFTVNPGLACTSFKSLLGDGPPTEMLRMVEPEAKITLDGIDYNIGGLLQENTTCSMESCPDAARRGIFTDDATLANMALDASAWQYVSHSVGGVATPFEWQPGTRHAPTNVAWPPRGISLELSFKAPEGAPEAHRALEVVVHYELYAGAPVMAKWLSISPKGSVDNEVWKRLEISPPVLSAVHVELLAVTRPYSPLPLIQYPPAQRSSDSAGDTDGPSADWSMHGRGGNNPYQGLLWVEKDQPHACSVRWQDDALVLPQGGLAPGAAEPLLNVSYDHHYPGTSYEFAVALDPALPGTEGGKFISFRALELVLDTEEKERSSLAMRKMRRMLAPAVQENPIFMHATANPTDRAGVRMALDQMQAVGFEMLLFSFGSGFNIESTDPTYIAKVKEQIDYAKRQGDIEVGAYDLIALTRSPPNASWREISPNTESGDGNACFASGWRDFLHASVHRFINQTGLSSVETDGPYGGQPCASTTHAYHRGLGDSIFRQNFLQAEFYKNLKARGLYIHQPDGYFYFGASKTGMGYNENQYSLPRWEDLSVSRAGMYDDTYYQPVTQGWMFVPLVPYHAGGDAAAFSPLSNHSAEYEWALAQYFGYGVMPCWRGAQLYDSDVTRSLVKKWVDFYKSYRDILSSDIVHLRRPDNRGIDAILHVNPALATKGLAVVYNPTNVVQKTSLPVSLYFTGISEAASVSEAGAASQKRKLNRDYSVHVPINMSPRSVTWFTFEDAGTDSALV